jgi:tRNA nucleotidyltransferase/poly(A) polymerase
MQINFNNLPLQYATAIKQIKEVAERFEYDVYIVGGFVRDLIADNKVSDDIDFIVDKKDIENPATKFVDLLVRSGVGKNVAIYETFGTAKVEVNELKVEFVMPRGEKYEEGNRKPINVNKVTLYEDAIRRDFTMNTLMIDMAGNVIDILGTGLIDLEHRFLRSANPNPNIMFKDDPLRILRYERFLSTKGFNTDPLLVESVKVNAKELEWISKERIREELNKLIMGDNVTEVLNNKIFVEYVLPQISPELYAMTKCEETPPYHKNESTWEHTVRVVGNVPQILHMRLAALFHDIGKPKVRTTEVDNDNPPIAHFYEHEKYSKDITIEVMKRLTYGNDIINIVAKLVRNHMRPHGYSEKWSDKAIRKFIVDLKKLGNDCMTLAIADSFGSGWNDEIEVKAQEKLNGMVHRILNVKRKPIHMKPIVNGDELMAMSGRESGKWVGEVIKYQMKVLLEDPEISKEELTYKLKNAIGVK